LQLIGELYAKGMIRTWLRDRVDGWHLTSGDWSPFYFMFREVPFFPELFQYSVDALVAMVTKIQQSVRVDALVGVASTGIPLGAGVALRTSLPLAFTRKVAGLRTVADLDTTSRAWGDHSLVEGKFKNGMRYLLVDDVVTGGASKELAKQQVEIEAQRRGLQLEYCGTVVVVDRGFPGHKAEGLGIHAKHRLYDELNQILEFGGTPREVAVMKRYLEDPGKFQELAGRSLLLAE
jgi:orotate phosphoribosyltransferase